MKTYFKLLAFAPGLFATVPAVAGIIVSAPVDVVGNLPLATFTGNNFATQSYKDWGNEPFVAINPTNTNDIVVSSFAFGTPTNPQASIFYSTNAGTSWTLQNTIPPPSTSVGIPHDWNFTYNSSGVLHGTIVGSDGNIYQGATANPTSLAAWSYTGSGTPINAASRGTSDQPWLTLSGSNVFVAYDAFQAGFVNPTERVAASTNNGTTFAVDNPISNGAQSNSVNPGTRIKTDGAGNVYSIFGVGSTTATPGVNNVTYYLNRSRDGGVTWDFNASSAVGGIVCATPARRLRTTGLPTSTTCAATSRPSHPIAPARMFTC
jgi:hypothetical protein